MSRKILIMACTLAFLVVLSLLEQTIVLRITNAALANTQEVIEQIREEKMDEAMKKTQEMDVSWDEQARWLEMMVDHSSTDEVRYAFSRLIAALEQEDSATAMVYACELEGAIEHVYERQALTIENII
ncbi:MAG: DUF4363 family protein [Clostridiales bacterium]|nr:DUF4363 family protein [Clostridiales bacterium]